MENKCRVLRFAEGADIALRISVPALAESPPTSNDPLCEIAAVDGISRVLQNTSQVACLALDGI